MKGAKGGLVDVAMGVQGSRLAEGNQETRGPQLLSTAQNAGNRVTYSAEAVEKLEVAIICGAQENTAPNSLILSLADTAIKCCESTCPATS